MHTKTSFTQAHLENKLWANELEFYRDEISIYRIHFDELVSRNTSLQESAKADELQNQFARQKDRINQLESELYQAEKQMAIYAQANTSADLDEVNVADHASFRERIESFKNDYQNLKKDFRQFESDL